MHCAKCFFFEADVGDDLCARCGRAFLPEANVYLGLLLLATAGAAFTLRHLLTGEVSPLARPEMDLGAWATVPLSLVEDPAYGLVLGGWLAALAVAPALTAMLYGKRGGWLLCLVEALLGPSLLLAGAAALGVWIAGGHSVRLGSKLASGLLALIPSAALWILWTWWSEVPSLGVTLEPLRYLPVVVAVPAGAVAVGLVVAVGRADRWHVRWPGVVLAAVTMAPVFALLLGVGIDRVQYAYLPAPGEATAARLVPAYRAFLARHGAGRAAAEARADLGQAIETARLRGRPLPEDTPLPQTVWAGLVREAPATPLATIAHLHLGDLAAAEALFEQAAEHYGAVLARTADLSVPAADPVAEFRFVTDALTVGAALRAREMARRELAARKAALLATGLLRENRTGAEPGDLALARMFKARRVKGTNAYREALLAAREAAPDGPLADNIATELALFEAEPLARLEAYRAVAARWPGTDGALLAHLAAADLLTGSAAADPAALRAARDQLAAAAEALAVRAAEDARHPYVLALADLVEQKTAYVDAQLRAPEEGR